MGSPAISINEDKYSKVSQRMQILGTTTDVTTNVNCYWISKRQGRPASKSSPKRKDGTRAPLGFSHVGRVSTAEICDFAYTDLSSFPRYRWSYQGGFPGNPGVFQDDCPDIPDRLVNEATLRCLTLLKDQKINLGVALAEARQTAELIGGAATDIANQIRRFKERNAKDWLRRGSWKKVPSRYLEMSYGWTPLMSDVHGAAEELSRVVNRELHQPQITATGSAGSSDFSDVKYGGTSAWRQVRRQISHRCDVSVVAKAPNWVVQEFGRLGLQNPLTIFWEKVPYSFVADWFLPVGSYIDTFDVTNYLQFTEGSVSKISRSKLVGRAKLEWDSTRYGDVKYNVLRPPTYRAWKFYRTTLGSFPRASLPSLRNPLSLDKMAKGLALLTQILR